MGGCGEGGEGPEQEEEGEEAEVHGRVRSTTRGRGLFFAALREGNGGWCCGGLDFSKGMESNGMG